MLLTVDVGNTNITFGIFDNDELLGTFRMNTGVSRTSDEYGIMISDMIKIRGIDYKKVTDVIISSVVPATMHSLVNAFKKYFNTKPIIVGPGIKTGIRVTTANPSEVGADRIVDAVGAYEIYGGPIMVIDYGTATTYDLVREGGTFDVAITAPGIRICANALWHETAKLPEIEIECPKTILANDTVTSMQAGLVYGQIGQTEYIINKVKEETGLKDMKVVATGGLGGIIFEHTDLIQYYDKELTLKGMKLIFDKQKKKKK